MAISHVCLRCGFDLARVRLADDRHYGLPLIICPHCRRASVRRRHLCIDRWRQTLRGARALGVAAAQLWLLGTFSLGVALLCITAGSMSAGNEFTVSIHPLPIAVGLAVVVLMCAALGAWLTAGLAHWPRWAAWASFFAWLAFILSFDVVTVPLLTRMMSRIVTDSQSIPLEADVWLARLRALGAAMVLALIGIPVGWVLQQAWRTSQRRRWSARRRKLRQRRNA